MFKLEFKIQHNSFINTPKIEVLLVTSCILCSAKEMRIPTVIWKLVSVTKTVV